MRKRRINRVSFISLLGVHVLLVLITLYKKKDRSGLLALLASNVGLAYLLEYFLLYYSGYRYKPKILKHNYMDNVLGGVLSQFIYVPFTAVFITAFNIGWVGKTLFASYFVLVEELFVKLKIYKQKWWRTTYTGLLIPFFFYISDYWYGLIKRKKTAVLHLSFFHMVMVIYLNIMFYIAVAKKFRLGFSIYHNWKKHFFVAPAYAAVATWILLQRFKFNNIWTGTMVTSLLQTTLDIFLKNIGFLRTSFPVGLSILFHLFMHYVASKCKNIFENISKTQYRNDRTIFTKTSTEGK
ncbi:MULTISPECIES: hypothetical protein [Bacillaceae]|uniref:Uncharacterized protein n=1 Tax=Evansella alkalicola TaxID=745819 RepID=A0ABS6JT19_9BACI|nr:MULTISPECIES: hypothetical protein [Bacillaceae]MBU9721712.1 hypothetical protein [Bacillus alkalicola]